jgi:ubiquinone/menaquinone biosynthesis C-methylase UbiE
MLAVARARCPEAQLLLGSGEGLPCPSDFFDLVLSIDVIHHIDDRGAYFAEAYRVLKPGGSLCTVTDSEEIIRGRHPQSTYFPETVDVELGRYPSVQQLKGLSSSAGFIHWRKSQVQLESQLTSAEAYAAKAMSSLHLISPEAFASGLERLENDLRRGPVSEVRAYVLLWATKPLAV